MGGAKKLQPPLVSTVAQQAEHYTLNNNKCCWQAGWPLAGEELSASPPQIQTSHTVDICNGATDNAAAPQSHGGSPQDMTWHTHSYTHTLKVTCMPFLTENANFFIFHSSHCSSFSSPRRLRESRDVTVGPGAESWIHLTMQFREIHIWKKGRGVLKEKQLHRTATSCYFTMPKNATKDSL